MYDTILDKCEPMPDLKVGRHYHASLAVYDRYVYVFCGIQNNIKKYINSIERYDHHNPSDWELIDIPTRQFPAR